MQFYDFHVDIDECTSKIHNCDRNGLCKNTEGCFTCTCKPGKWGHERDQNSLYDHPAFKYSAYHWLLEQSGRWECDDYGVGVSRGDFWKVFVR